MEAVTKWLVEAFQDYKNTPIHNRWSIRKKLSEAFDQSPMTGMQILHSSGSSGKIKIYKYGPHAYQVGNFYYEVFSSGSNCEEHKCLKMVGKDLCLDGVDQTFVMGRSQCPFHEGRKTVYVRQDMVANKNLMRQAILGGLSKVGVHVTPISLQILRRNGFVPQDLFDPSEVTFYCTGEALENETKKICEGFEIRDHMRCWDGGATFYTCEYGHTHWLDMVFEMHHDSENRLITTDSLNKAQRFHEYWNGDIVRTEREEMCPCGMPIDRIDFLDKPILYFTIGNGRYFYDYMIHEIKRIMNEHDLPNEVLESVSFGMHRERIVVFYSAKIGFEEMVYKAMLTFVNSYLPKGSVIENTPQKSEDHLRFKMRKMFILDHWIDKPKDFKEI